MCRLFTFLFLSIAITACGPNLSLEKTAVQAANDDATQEIEPAVSVLSGQESDLLPESVDSDIAAPTQLVGSDNAEVDTTGNTVELDDSANDERNTVVDVIIPRIDPAVAPKIDGQIINYLGTDMLLAGEWQVAVQADTQGRRLRINSLMFDNTGAGSTDSFNHHWAAVHDGTYLYVLVISDDAGLHLADTDDQIKIWKDDGIELYIDGNNSKLDSYDGVDDYQISINLMDLVGASNNSYTDTTRFTQATNSATLPSDLIFATGLRKGPQSPRNNAGRQDVYEIRIKISELNIRIGQLFGIELQINDDDTGGSRDTKWGWKHPPGTADTNDMTWQNPSHMGTAMLI